MFNLKDRDETLYGRKFICRKCGVYPKFEKKLTTKNLTLTIHNEKWFMVYGDNHEVLDSICPSCIRKMKLKKLREMI